MADIHIGSITQVSKIKGIVRIILHIPINSPKALVVPTPISSLSGLLQSEIDALAAGTIVEELRNIVVLSSESQVNIVARIRILWAAVKAEYNTQYDFKYKFNGVTLSATA